MSNSDPGSIFEGPIRRELERIRNSPEWQEWVQKTYPVYKFKNPLVRYFPLFRVPLRTIEDHDPGDEDRR